MRAMQIIEWGKPLEAREYPDPEPSGEEVLLRVEAAGVCHSDVHKSTTPNTCRILLQVPGVRSVTRMKGEPGRFAIAGGVRELPAPSPIYTAIYEGGRTSQCGWRSAASPG
jgi:hypothetical protein